MKTRTKTMTAFLLVGILALFGFAYPTAINADDTAASGITIEGKEGTYTTIEAAVEAAEPGDTILLPAGTFDQEKYTIQKAVNLKGAGMDETIVTGEIDYRGEQRYKDFGIEHTEAITIENIGFAYENSKYGVGITFADIYDGYKPTYGNPGEQTRGEFDYEYNVFVKNCSFVDYINAIAVNNCRDITLNVESNYFENIYSAIGAEYTSDANGVDMPLIKFGTLSGNAFVDVDYEISPYYYQYKTTANGGIQHENKCYTVIADFIADSDFNNPAYNGDGPKLEQWPAEVKNIADAGSHKYYVSLEEALRDADAAEKKLVLRNDVECEDITIPEGTVLSIDFNGHTLAANILNNGEAVFSDSVGGGGLADGFVLTNNGVFTNIDGAIAPENIKDNVADQKAAERVDALIDAIGPADQVTLDSFAAIDAAVSAYKALTDEQKKLVTGLDDLNAAIDAYNALLDDEKEDPKDEPSDKPVDKPDKNDDADKEDGKSPQTGDNTSMLSFILLAITAAAAAGTTAAVRRREK